MRLALYKGPPSKDLFHLAGHYLTRLWTWSKYSHAELVIDGVCYSSSSRDGGVRSKVIDLTSGKWDVFEIESSDFTARRALLWFELHENDKYDWLNILRFVLPFIKQDRNKWVCYESIGAALGIREPHKLDADSLLNALLNHGGRL